MHFLQAINSDLSVLIVCNKTGGTIKGDIKKWQIIFILVITFMQGVDNNITQTSHVSRVYSVAAALYLQFVLPLQVMLFRL